MSAWRVFSSWVLAAVCLIGSPAGRAADDPAGQPVHPAMDALERRLELRSHQLLLDSLARPGQTLQAFDTDGCSGGLSVGWAYLAQQLPRFARLHHEHPPWESCCVAHDRSYHRAVPKSASAQQSFNARRDADLELERCVASYADTRSVDLKDAYGLSQVEVELLYGAISALMYRAVRLGGVPCSGLPWRWGYGWPACAR